MARQATSYLDMASLWDLHGFISSSESDELFSDLLSVRQKDRDEELEALMVIVQDGQASEIVRVYAVKAYTIQTKANDETVLQLKSVLLQEGSTPYLRMAVVQTLRYINSKTAANTLVEVLALIREVELQALASQAIYNHMALSWQEKCDRLLETLKKGALYREHLLLEVLLRAILPPADVLQSNRFALTDYLIKKTVGWFDDERMAGILAGLIIESVGRNLNRANERAAQFQRVEPDEGLHLDLLLSEMNSRLTPAEMEARLQRTFYEPLNDTNKRIQAMWEKAIANVQESLEMRVRMGAILIGSSLALMIGVIIYYLITRQLPEALLGALISLILLAIATIYSGPLRNLRQVLADIGVANVVYAAYVQRTLEISNGFARRYLQDKLDPGEIEKSNKLIGAAMNDTVKALRDSGPASLDEFIDQLTAS